MEGKILNCSIEDFKRCAVYHGGEPFINKMLRGIKDDKCEDLLKAYVLEEDNPEMVAGFIATKHYKTYSNLKWIMTFPKFRGQGAFRALCEDAVRDAWNQNETLFKEHYFRVSINGDALEAYKRVGFKVCGEQRSDCFLSAGKLTSEYIKDIDWSYDDRIIKWMNQQPRGGCVVKYDKAK